MEDLCGRVFKGSLGQIPGNVLPQVGLPCLVVAEPPAPLQDNVPPLVSFSQL